MAKSYLIPFTKNDMTGTVHMMEYTTAKEGALSRPDGVDYLVPDEWRPNTTFEALIRIEEQYRGRSAARVRCRNSINGEVYSMGLQAFFEAVMMFGAAPDGYINGKWTFRKQGSNYTLFPVKPEKPTDKSLPHWDGCSVTYGCAGGCPHSATETDLNPECRPKAQTCEDVKHTLPLSHFDWHERHGWDADCKGKS